MARKRKRYKNPNAKATTLRTAELAHAMSAAMASSITGTGAHGAQGRNKRTRLANRQEARRALENCED